MLNTQYIDHIRDKVNEFTGLKAEFIGALGYDDPRLMEVPIIIPVGFPNEAEMENLARYLLAGGFILGGCELADHGRYCLYEYTFPGGQGKWAEILEKYGGLVQGQDFWTEPLTDDHPVYSAFFDLPVGHGNTENVGQGSLNIGGGKLVYA